MNKEIQNNIIEPMSRIILSLKEEAYSQETEAEKFAVLDLIRRLEELTEELDYLLG